MRFILPLSLFLLGGCPMLQPPPEPSRFYSGVIHCDDGQGGTGPRSHFVEIRPNGRIVRDGQALVPGGVYQAVNSLGVEEFVSVVEATVTDAGAVVLLETAGDFVTRSIDERYTWTEGGATFRQAVAIVNRNGLPVMYECEGELELN